MTGVQIWERAHFLKMVLGEGAKNALLFNACYLRINIFVSNSHRDISTKW